MMPASATVTESNREMDVNSRSETSLSANGSTPWIIPLSATSGRSRLPSVSDTITLPTSPSVWMRARLSSRMSGRASSSIAMRTVIGSPGALGNSTASTRPTEMPL